MIHQAPQFLPPLTPVNTLTQRCSVTREQASHRIVIMRAGAFGDILMGTPLLAALRRAYPNAFISWIAEHSEVQAIDASPYIDEFIRWDGHYWKRPLRKANYVKWLWRAFHGLRAFRKLNCDIFISLQPEEWPLMLKGLNAPITIGVFDTFRRYNKDKPTSKRTKLYTYAYAFPELPDHRIDQYFLTLKALGLPPSDDKQMTMGFTAEDAGAVTAFLERHGVKEGQPFVVDVPMTTWPSKCWPAERHIALCDTLAERHGLPIVMIGSKREAEGIAAIAAQMKHPPIPAAGVMTFREVAALIARASLLVSGDTGPMHVAAAVGTPNIALFGSTGPQWYAPQNSRGIVLSHPVPCGPCDQKFCGNEGENHMLCMKLLTVQEVLSASEKLLSSVPVEGVGRT
ncbi:MAG: glycosyltransferase family 9 protein [Capsulimonas sp.]|uniref:glycosyltransferase family 9 protein n=1 Tax=Capsulimonas sp. TaxID=2494211 RepID=UPI0032651B3A